MRRRQWREQGVRAGVSPGFLYQFFPNKEAIAQAYAASAVEQVHGVYDDLLAPPLLALPLAAFIDTFIDALLVVDRAYPGYFALTLASTLSAPLADALAGLQGSAGARLAAVFAARWRGAPPRSGVSPD